MIQKRIESKDADTRTVVDLKIDEINIQNISSLNETMSTLTLYCNLYVMLASQEANTQPYNPKREQSDY